MPSIPHLPHRAGRMTAGLALALVVAAVLGIAAVLTVLRRPAPPVMPDSAASDRPAAVTITPEAPGAPSGLVAARSRAGEADVVAFDGRDWVEIVPASALPPVEEEGRVLAETIRFVAVEPGLDRAALVVAYCGGGESEAEPCATRGYVFDRATGDVLRLDDEVVPTAWLPDGRLLVDAISAGGRIVDPATGDGGPIAGPDADYTIGFGGGLSPDGRWIAISTGRAEKIVDVATGAAVVLGGDGSVDRTPWLAFSPDGLRVAAAQSRVVGVSPSGDETTASRVAIFDAVSGARMAGVGDDDGDAHDVAPAWANGGRSVVFLRSAGDADSADFAELARVMRYDLDTGQTVALVDTAAWRRDVVVPEGGSAAAFLERTAGGPNAIVTVDIATGSTSSPSDAAFDYTSLAWAPVGRDGEAQ